MFGKVLVYNLWVLWARPNFDEKIAFFVFVPTKWVLVKYGGLILATMTPMFRAASDPSIKKKMSHLRFDEKRVQKKQCLSSFRCDFLVLCAYTREAPNSVVFVGNLV